MCVCVCVEREKKSERFGLLLIGYLMPILILKFVFDL